MKSRDTSSGHNIILMIKIVIVLIVYLAINKAILIKKEIVICFFRLFLW